MPYSLVSAATLGFDLVRLPAGRSVAQVLLGGLAADGEQLHRLAWAHPGRGASRERRGVLAVRSRRARELAVAVPQVRHLGEDAGADASSRVAVLVAQLERGTIGDVPTLERLLRDDVLGAEHPAASALPESVRSEAADVLADAAVGFWAADVLPPLVHRELTAPFTSVTNGAPDPAAIDLGPATGGMGELLTAVRRLDDAGRARWRAAVEDGRGEHRPWAAAMHEASWAAHVSGRTRSLATAQLHAVQAFVDGGFDGRDGASGVWNALAGCVQGLAMGDLLGADTLRALLAPWDRVTGSRPGAC